MHNTAIHDTHTCYPLAPPTGKSGNTQCTVSVWHHSQDWSRTMNRVLDWSRTMTRILDCRIPEQRSEVREGTRGGLGPGPVSQSSLQLVSLSHCSSVKLSSAGLPVLTIRHIAQGCPMRQADRVQKVIRSQKVIRNYNVQSSVCVCVCVWVCVFRMEQRCLD